LINGGPGSKVVEQKVVVRDYPAQWKRPQIDTKELAKLRFKKGWALIRLARHFGLAKSTIGKKLDALKTEA